MTYIYKITNIVNNKIYIGKTTKSLDERFKTHIRDSYKFKNRLLYIAMRKYGSDNFVIEKIESCEDCESDYREVFWIETLDSFNNGYNATFGGKGRKFIDRKLVLKIYEETKKISETSKIIGCDDCTTRAILKENGIETIYSEGEHTSKKVLCLNKSNKSIIKTFPSTREASRWIIESLQLNSKNEGGISGKISSACKGKRKTAYGYMWKYV